MQKYKAKTVSTVVSQLALDLIEDIRMEDWLKEDGEEGEDRWHNVQELVTVMHKYDALDPMNSLVSFLEEVALVSEVDKLGEGGADALTLMTLHLCKGLEFEHVIIVGCEEGLFPHSNSMFDKEQLEEERRIMYVGMTRAQHHLRIMFAASRFLWGENRSGAPSRFLDDLPDEFIERRSDEILSAFAWAGGIGQSKVRTGKLEPFRQTHPDVSIEFNQDLGEDTVNQDAEIDEGTRIEHPSFGKGTVLSRRGDVVEIKFDNGQKKTFALSIAPLKVI
jgi:DNA helicase-2/ATP-dependent DNA helicase PcrA